MTWDVTHRPSLIGRVVPAHIICVNINKPTNKSAGFFGHGRLVCGAFLSIPSQRIFFFLHFSHRSAILSAARTTGRFAPSSQAPATCYPRTCARAGEIFMRPVSRPDCKRRFNAVHRFLRTNTQVVLFY